MTDSNGFNGNHEYNERDQHDYGGGGGGVPEPPAVVGSWTFPMKGMFPAPRPFVAGHKTYASGAATGAGKGFKDI